MILKMVIAAALNLVIVVGLIVKFVFPIIKKGLAKKSEDIANLIDETERNLESINQEMAEYRTKMQAMESEVAQIRNEAEARGQAAAEKIQSDTEREIEALKKRVDQQVEQEYLNLKLRLRSEFVNEVMTLARTKAETELNKTSHANLIEQFAFSLKDFKEYKS